MKKLAEMGLALAQRSWGRAHYNNFSAFFVLFGHFDCFWAA